MKKVAFICVHNSCRSQIAEALCKFYREDLEAYSAGTELKPNINQDAVRIMRDRYNIDMTGQYSKLLKEIPKCDIYISMGCNVVCPFIGRDFDDNFNIDDPTGKTDDVFVEVVEAIKEKIMKI